MAGALLGPAPDRGEPFREPTQADSATASSAGPFFRLLKCPVSPSGRRTAMRGKVTEGQGVAGPAQGDGQDQDRGQGQAQGPPARDARRDPLIIVLHDGSLYRGLAVPGIHQAKSRYGRQLPVPRRPCHLEARRPCHRSSAHRESGATSGGRADARTKIAHLALGHRARPFHASRAGQVK
jgi:hypothetical protein